MPRLLGDKLPAYRKHKSSGQAIVTINGRDHYLGPHGTTASRKEYDRLIAEWITNGRTAPLGKPDATIVEVLAAYLRFAKCYYRQSGEYDNMVYALKPLKESYGRLPAAEFSPLKLKVIRQKLIDASEVVDGVSRRLLCRNEINQRIGRIKRFFAWGVENELIPAHVLHGLRAVRGLSRGRSEARECEPVKPVPEAHVDAIENKVSPQIWAMVQLQRFTGCRPGEVTVIRTCDIDTSGKVWVYTPQEHKNAWHREQRNRARTTPLSCGNRIGTNRTKGRKPKRRPGEQYDVKAYCYAIRRACGRANVPIWSPNRLRHNAATWLRKEFGLDVARVVLGHRSPQTTEVYAELDQNKACDVMSRVG